MEPEDMVMPFGQHQGLTLGEIPAGYLRWVRDKADAASPQLKEACRQLLERAPQIPFPSASRNAVDSAAERVGAELQRLRADLQKIQSDLYASENRRGQALREVENLRRELSLVRAEADALRRQAAIGRIPAGMGDTIKAWYRKLSMEFHPDRGGSGAAMAAVNRAHAMLKTMLGI